MKESNPVMIDAVRRALAVDGRRVFADYWRRDGQFIDFGDGSPREYAETIFVNALDYFQGHEATRIEDALIEVVEETLDEHGSIDYNEGYHVGHMDGYEEGYSDGYGEGAAAERVASNG